VSRTTALARLAVAYGRHQVGRRFRRPRPQLAHLLEIYASDRLEPLSAEERRQLPELSGCILCGACALAVGRYGSVRLPDLASGHLRSYDLLRASASDLAGERPDLEAAAAACPVGVPLPAVAAVVARLSGSNEA
jgi:hypothetical protein